MTNLKTISYTANNRQAAVKQLELDLLFFPLKFVQLVAMEFIEKHERLPQATLSHTCEVTKNTPVWKNSHAI